MEETIQERIVTTELRPFLRAKGWNFYMSLKCCSGENSDIFNVIDDMRFKLLISWKDDKREDSQMEELFESPGWVYTQYMTITRNGHEYEDVFLDTYELTQGGGYMGLNLSNCLEEVFSDYNRDDEDDERVDELKSDIIDNLEIGQLMKKAVVEYIKSYF